MSKKAQFFESDFTEAQNNYPWITNLTTTLQTEVELYEHFEGPGAPPVVPGSLADAKIRTAIALGLIPVEALDEVEFEEDGFLPVDALALRIRERLVGDVNATEEAERRQSAKPDSEDDSTEAEEHASLRGKLPDGFAGKAALAAADPPITTYGQARKVKDLTAIDGIGEPTAEKIRQALGASDAEAGAFPGSPPDVAVGSEPTLEPGAKGPSTGTLNSGVNEETQTVDEEASDEDVLSGTDSAPFSGKKSRTR